MSSLSDFLKLVIHRRFASKSAIESYQLNELKRLVDHSIQHSLFYKQTLGDIEINQLSDLKKLPIINKTIMMDNFDQLNTASLTKDEVLAVAVEKELNKDYLGYYKDEFVIGLSSGTSGNKVSTSHLRRLQNDSPLFFWQEAEYRCAICLLRSCLCCGFFPKVSMTSTLRLSL
jgi:phenylacetate-coenzyme A ligase PaaK-like adenylate-forming protein